MQVKRLASTILFLIFSSLVFGQNGVIRGTVYDGKTGETLPGVTIYIEETTMGTITDLDGEFNLSIKPGTYQMRVSFISYETLHIKEVIVQAGKTVLFDNLQLNEATIELGEAVVTANFIRNTEAAMVAIKRQSANLLDGISSVAFRKTGDSDAASSMKRVPGVSIDGGKYVFVRGLGDRYTKTILNGIDVPGLDPDRNTLQMDIFPTNVIDNIIVHKSFTADLPADFTGGVIDITLKDFPEEKQGNISLGAGYNPDYHFNPDYLSYEGSKTDFLGFDDGTRKIPVTTDIPFFTEAVGNPDGERGQRYREILESFNPVMAARMQKSFMDYSIGMSFGNQFARPKVTLGYNVALSYKNDTEFYKNAEYGRYGLSDPDIYEMDVREHRKGDFGVNNILLSGLAGFSLKTFNSKYGITILHLQNGESKAGVFDYTGSDKGSNFDALQHNLDYSQRSLSNLLIDGKHRFSSTWNLEWKLSPSYSRIDDPDSRFTRYEVRNDGASYAIGTEVGFPERIWRELDEINTAGLFHVAKDFNFRQRKAKLKFGGAYTYKERDYMIRKFLLNIRGNVPLTGNPNELLNPDNLWPYQGRVGTGTAFETDFFPDNSNQFNANVNYIAGYVSANLQIFENLKADFGVRIENYTLRYTGQNQYGDKVLDNEKVLDDLGFFPNINFIYSLTEKQNLRLSYSSTIARPSFKELSYAEIFDPLSDRTFIGGLFNDVDEVAGIEYWDGNLVSTNIRNFDLRWELFEQKGQMISLSGFYKKFKNPIEMVQYFTQTGAFQPRNVGDGDVYGVETEFRLNLSIISETFKNLSLSSNITLAKSRIKLSKTEYDSRVRYARTGQTIDDYRDMAGQAPYIVNSGLSYDGGENGFWKGLGAGLYYNIQGPTLQYVGISDKPDIFVKPFNSLNFNANKNMGKDERFQLGFKVDNLLNDKKESVFRSYQASDQYFESLSPGTTFQFKVGYSF